LLENPTDNNKQQTTITCHVMTDCQWSAQFLTFTW